MRLRSIFVAVVLAFSAGGVLAQSPDRPPAELVQGRTEFARKNFNGAYLLLLPFAHRGNAEAQFLLGRMSDEGGGGIALDPREAARWYRQAASLDYAPAHYMLAMAYATGRGVTQTPTLALDHLEKAASLDYTPAILDLASLYDDGRGVEPDRPRGYALFRRAADLGNTEARFVVGERLTSGDGTDPNRDEARRWYQLAAGRGHPGAMFRLAQIGYGLDKGNDSRVVAYAFLTLAMQRGASYIRGEAQKLRDQLARTMIQTDIDQAMQRVRSWKPSPPMPGDAFDPDDPYNSP